MARKSGILILILILILLGILFSIYFWSNGSESSQLRLAKVNRGDIQLTVSTNGIIEPAERSEVYAPINAIVASIPNREGSQIAQGRLLILLESEQVRTALAEAKASLLQGKREARVILTGPSKEELAELETSLAECSMQLNQANQDLSVEESLFSKGAAARIAVDNLRKQRDLLQVRLEGLKKKKQELQQRYSSEDREWEQDKVAELTKQVRLLEQQLQMESILAPKSGLIYSLLVKPGAYVTKGQLIAQIYQPGKILLRAYVDEPDLGRIKKGQPARIAWDGMPDTHWDGIVDKPAEQVVALNNRSVGHVFCSISGTPKELIPNLNVKVEITTSIKKDVLVVPKSAVFSQNGKPSVLLFDGTRTMAKTVSLGLVTSEEIELISGISAGDSIVLNPAEVKTDQ
jgi:HlyD family secretion protein